MITVQVGDESVVLVPRSLQDYIHKVDYIKKRRPSPYEALDGVPESMSADGKQKIAEIALTSYMKMSSVSFEEELAFDCSLEGFYYSLWQGAKASMKGWSKLTPIQGVSAARDWFDKLDNKKATEIRLALRGLDQRALAKNSDGPPENPE